MESSGLRSEALQGTLSHIFSLSWTSRNTDDINLHKHKLQLRAEQEASLFFGNTTTVCFTCEQDRKIHVLFWEHKERLHSHYLPTITVFHTNRLSLSPLLLFSTENKKATLISNSVMSEHLKPSRNDPGMKKTTTNKQEQAEKLAGLRKQVSVGMVRWG